MLINLTPHDIVVRINDHDIVIPASGQVARVSATQDVVGNADGIPVVRSVFSDVTGLPDPVDGVTYIVSSLVAQACRRRDVVAPDTGPTAIRDDVGRIVAVTRFQVF